MSRQVIHTFTDFSQRLNGSYQKKIARIRAAQLFISIKEALEMFISSS
jgi:hypothetical protein